MNQRRCFSTKEEGAPKKEEGGEAPKKDEKKKPAEEAKKGKQEDSSSSSSDEEGAAETLSKEDIVKIKKLIAEQDKEIETLKEQVKSYKEKLIY